MEEKRKTICFKLYLDKQYAAKNLHLNFLLSFNILFSICANFIVNVFDFII